MMMKEQKDEETFTNTKTYPTVCTVGVFLDSLSFFKEIMHTAFILCY